MASSICASIVTASVTHIAFLRVTVRVSEYSLKTEHLIPTVAMALMANMLLLSDYRGHSLSFFHVPSIVPRPMSIFLA